MRRFLLGAALVGLLLGGWLGGPAYAQGPYSSQITRALRAFKATAQTFTGAVTFSGGAIIGGTTSTAKFADGTSGAPSIAFASETTLGFWRAGAGLIGAGATITLNPSNGQINVTTGGSFRSSNFGTKLIFPTANGLANFQNNGDTIGVQFKFDALPTVASGFGTSPAVTAGSTPMAGSVNVGTGASSSGVVNFNGTAFPSAPFVVCMDDSSILAVKCTATTTQLTISAVAFTASDVISWMAVSSK
jgi:hypothetical protein